MSWRPSSSWRLLRAGLLIVSLLLVSAAATIVHAIRTTADSTEVRTLHTTAVLLAERYREAVRSGGPVEAASQSIRNLGLRCTLLQADGTVLADSAFNPSLLANRLFDPEVQEALVSEYGVAVSYRIESQTRERVVCVAIRGNGSVIGFAEASSPAVLPFETAEGLMVRSLLVLLICAIACSSATFGLARSAVRPLAELSNVFERRSLAELASLAMRADASEMGQLQLAAYRLLQESNSLLEREQHQSEAFAAVLESVPQAIAILDDQALVVSANHQFRQIFGNGHADPVGRHVVELLALPPLLSAIDQCLKNGVPQSVLAEDGGKYFTGRIRVLDELVGAKRRFLVVVEDITEAMSLARIKADFVTNASHELKTPLTAMKGYVELLKEDPGNERYLGIVERNLDRLIALTSDISSLSRLENVEPEFGVVDVSELQHDLTELFQHQAQATGIPLVFSIADDARFVRGDKLMLLQLFINLIENSYRFTERGRIDVSATVDGDAVVFVVRDTGVGIPEQQIPRIFERFYSRDRLHGRTGTGLGLAIAKRVVLAHGGTIAADSPRGAGAAFTIRIPRGAHSAMQTTSKNRLKEDS